MTVSRPARFPLLLALFLSGLAGLVHEVAWVKLLAEWIGSTAAAQAIVLGVFMAGLAVGAWFFGRRSDRRERPLATYALLEVAIAVYCALLPTITGAMGRFYASSLAANFDSEGMRFALRLVIAAAVVLPPALWMGGTLPIVARAAIDSVSATRARVAGLYALNNLGAVLGAGLSGFALLPALGIQKSLLVASTLNLCAAAVAYSVRNQSASGAVAPPEPEPPPRYSSATFAATLVALLFAGFAAMGYEVVIVRVIALSLGSSTYSFTLMLIGFIFGIGLGSAVVSLVRVERPLWWLAASQMAAVASMLALTAGFERLPYWSTSLRLALSGPDGNGTNFPGYLLSQGSAILALLLVPTVCIGMGFPLVAHVHARSVRSIGNSVGTTYAWNTIGNVLGSLVTSLVLVPSFGIAGALHANLALQCAAALILLVLATEAAVLARVTALAAVAFAALLYVAFGSDWSDTLNLAQSHFRAHIALPPDATDVQRAEFPTASLESWKRVFNLHREKTKDLLISEDSDSTVVAARDASNPRLAYLMVNGKGDASTEGEDMLTQELLAHAPLFMVPKTKSMLVVGYGSGVTCGSALRHPIEALDVVEISRGVLKADEIFKSFNYGALSDPRTHMYREDARTFLRTSPKKYDLIVSEPSNPWIAGIGGLFTVDFFRDAAERLNPGGALCMWFHEYDQSDATVELVLRSLHEVFPHAEIFFSHSNEVIAVCSKEPLVPDFAAMESRFENVELRRDLARIGIPDLVSLLAYHAVSDSRFAAAIGSGPLNTDDHQLLEYWAAENLFVGRASGKLVAFEGWTAKADGTTDALLDRYSAWRAQLGEPVTHPELSSIARVLPSLLPDPNHRVVGFVLSRWNAAPMRTAPPSSVARGREPEFATLSFAEACNRGDAAVREDDAATATRYYRRALELDPGNWMPTQRIFQMLANDGRNDEALAQLEESLAARPKDPDLLLFVARVYFQADNLERAKGLLELRCAADQPPNAEALWMLGKIVSSEQNVPRAIELCERAWALDRNAWQAAYQLAVIYASNPSTLDRAKLIFRDAIGRQPRLQQLLELRQQLPALAQ